MGAGYSQPEERVTPTVNPTVNLNANRYESPTVNPNANRCASLTVYPNANRYDNPNLNPVICVKNVLAAGKFDPGTERENKRILNEFLDALLEIMKEKDRDFARLFQKLYYTGSYYENLRISDPNEFDINLILKLPFKPGERNFEYVGEVKSFMKYKLNSSAENNGVFWENVDLLNKLFEGEYLSPVKVRCWLQAVVDRARPSVPMPVGVRRIIPSASGPAKTMVLETVHGYNIDIDLVPVIQFNPPEWPSGARRNMLSTFEVRNEDCFWFLVPKEFPASETMVNPFDAKRLWRIHFPEIEKKIIHNRGQVKPLIKLLKALRNNEGWQILASYYLKTVVLWLVEQNPSPHYWMENNIYSRLIEVMEALKECVSQRFIQYYFYPEFNLIQKMGQYQADNICNRLGRILRDIRANPQKLEVYFQI